MWKKKNIAFFLLLFLLYSCETVSDWTESIGSDSEEIDPSLGEILADSDPEASFEGVEVISEEEQDLLSDDNVAETTITEADESLPPVPQTEYDSSSISGDDGIINEELDNQVVQTPPQAPIQPTILNFPGSTLNLSDKIQYKVATINFVSGSSNVGIKGLKKIKKIAKLAKERNAKIKIVGHASKRTKDMPIAEHKLVNFVISDKRAQSVAQVFVKKHNFPGERLITEAVSDAKPLFKEIMPAGTKANQRTEIFIIY